jgi:hypothetical protein
MDSLSNRTNRPAQAQPTQRQSPQSDPVPLRTEPERERIRRQPATPQKKRWPWVVAAIIIVLLLAAGVAFFKHTNSIASEIDSNRFQFIKLQNTIDGPEYFGKLSVVNDDYYRLTDVFYLKRKTTDTNTNDEESVEDVDASDFELIKLGNELHGPDDEMIIPRQNVLYFENLKSDGTVSKTINTYLEQNKQ